jgi:uncharacterized membrane-anchored protein YjiN (DUF445 family)
MNDLINAGLVERRIYIFRLEKVMLDSDLAELYGVPTKRLNEQVRRNLKRFPKDFMFTLTWDESSALRSHSATLKTAGRGRHRKYLTRAFTELGVAMLSSVLNSERAIRVNIAIMRVFQKLRRMLAEHKELAAMVTEHEHRLNDHDQDIAALIETVPRPPEPEPELRPVLGFTPPPERKRRAKP